MKRHTNTHILIGFLAFSALFCVLNVQIAEAGRKKDGWFLDKYDKDLKTPPFAIRFKYKKEMKKNWEKSSYQERYDFIEKWELKKEAEEKANKIRAIKERRENLKIMREERREKQLERRKELNKKREEQREELREKRRIQKKLREEKKRLILMKRKQKQRMQDLRN